MGPSFLTYVVVRSAYCSCKGYLEMSMYERYCESFKGEDG